MEECEGIADWAAVVQVILSAPARSIRFQGASGTVYKAVYDPSLALSGRGEADEDDLGLSVVRSTCSVAVKKMKVGADLPPNACTCGN